MSSQTVNSTRSRRSAGTSMAFGVLVLCLLLFGLLSWAFLGKPAFAAGGQSITRQFSPSGQAAETTNAGDNDGFETTPTNAFASDNAYAVDTNSGGTPAGNTTCTATKSDKHRFSTYGMGAIPGGSTISGITVRVDMAVDALTDSPFACVDLSYDAGTNFTAAKQQVLSATAETSYTLGGVADTWGRTWAASELNDTNFRLRVINGATAGSLLRDFSLDWIPVSITFTAVWDSYNNAARTTQDDTFGEGETTVYMRGTGFNLAGSYVIGYYDGSGDKRCTETIAASAGTLDSSCAFRGAAATGTWHAVTFQPLIPSPSTYGAINQDTHKVVADDTFTVQTGAVVPEMPSMIASGIIGAATIAVFWWFTASGSRTRRRVE